MTVSIHAKLGMLKEEGVICDISNMEWQLYDYHWLWLESIACVCGLMVIELLSYSE